MTSSRSISHQRKRGLKMELFVAETQKKFLMSAFWLSAILLAFSSITLECKEEEAEALLGWKASLLQSHALQSWASLSMPISNSTPAMYRPCSWAGITCGDAGNVMEIRLSNASLKGSLHNFSFTSFPNLTHLDLSRNSLFGTIPAEISSLSSLSLLDLSHNRLSGPIPSSFGKLEDSLTHLNISQTSISGTIPSELGHLKNLVQLCLYSNKLSGPIPPSLGNLTHLTHLSLYDNQLLGPIRQELGNLSSLIHLDLSKNNLSGSIPSSLGRLTKLTRLSLFPNQISGPIPPQTRNLENLFQFLLYENRSSRVIQQQTGNLQPTAPVDVAVVHRHLNQVDDYERAAPVGPDPVDDDEPHA